MFLIAALRIIFNTECVGTWMIYLNTKFLMPNACSLYSLPMSQWTAFTSRLKACQTILQWACYLAYSRFTFRTLCWNSHNSHAISCELLHSSYSTAAIMAYPLAGVCTASECSTFTWAVGVTLPVSHRWYINCQNSLVSGWSRPQ
jgi:hypothetical protein